MLQVCYDKKPSKRNSPSPSLKILMRGIETKGDVIRQARISLGWTQEELAHQSGCAARTVRSAEKNQRLDLETVNLISAALALPISEIANSPATSDELQKSHIEIVLDWQDANEAADIERILAFHSADTILELPDTANMPAGGDFDGIDQLRNHLTELFTVFRIKSVADVNIDACGQLVFHRTTTTVASVATGKKSTTRFLNEFEFADRKICRRTAISDLSGLKEILS